MEWNKPCTAIIGKIDYPRGSLSVLQYPDKLPFEPVDARWLTAETAGGSTEGCAHFATNLVIASLTGTLKIVTEHSEVTKVLTLHTPDEIAYIPFMTWYEIEFTPGAVALIVSDALADALDVITDKREFETIESDGLD